MRLLFIRPAYDTRSISPNFPIGIASLAAAVRQHGHRPEVMDLPMLRAPLESLEQRLRQNFYPLIGISAMTIQYPGALDAVRVIRKASPSSRIVLGGPHPSVTPKETLQQSGSDFVIFGEGEAAIVRLADALEAGGDGHGVPSLVYKSDGSVRMNPAGSLLLPEEIPLPAYDLFDLETYFKIPMSEYIRPGGRPVPIFTSRGCPFHCTFCHELFSKQFRARSPESILAEVTLLHDRYRANEFLIYDDIFNLDLQRAKRFFRLIIAAGLKIGFSFPNGMRAELMDEELMALMSQAGVHTISIAVETASERMQKVIKKHLKLPKVPEFLRLAKKYGVRTQAFFIIGFPEETRIEIEQTIRYARSLHDLDWAFFSFATPYPGTELARQAGGHTLNMSSLDFFEPHIETEQFSFRQLRWLRLKAVLLFYSTPQRVWNLLTELLNPHFTTLYLAPMLRVLRFHHEGRQP